jgi:hypothetical protein
MVLKRNFPFNVQVKDSTILQDAPLVSLYSQRLFLLYPHAFHFSSLPFFLWSSHHTKGTSKPKNLGQGPQRVPAA